MANQTNQTLHQLQQQLGLQNASLGVQQAAQMNMNQLLSSGLGNLPQGLGVQHPGILVPGKIFQTEPEIDTAKKLWVGRDYCLHYQYKVSGLSFKNNTVVCTWEGIPTRSMLAAAIKWHRLGKLQRNARDAFGSLLGVRIFRMANCWLYSPAQGTPWESSVLRAPTWDEQQAVRGTCGIHAAWPPRSLKVVPKIDTVAITHQNVFASVRGQGRFVAGEEGWRAEEVIIDTVYLPFEQLQNRNLLKQITKQYPEIDFVREPWSLER